VVKFNVEDETGFLSSLEYLGEVAEEEVLEALENIEAKNLKWNEFVDNHGWLRVELSGQDTYPGADPLFWFAIVGASSTIYQIAAKGPYGAVVVCSVCCLPQEN
jgi:hypothetical protein